MRSDSPLTTARSPLIHSVRVSEVPARLVFVVTANPMLVGVVGEFLRQTDRHVSAIWLPSVASACRRLQRDAAAMVVLDDTDVITRDAVSALQAAAPETRVLVLDKETTRR